MVPQSHLFRRVSFTKLVQGFKAIASTVLASSLSFSVEVPIETDQVKQKYSHCFLKVNDGDDFLIDYEAVYERKSIDLNKIKNNGVKI